MDLATLLHDLLFDYTLRTVALGTAVIGIVSGALGCFALLRKQSLLGDTISHAALPGVVIAFLLTRSRAPLGLLLGAMLTGWLATILVLAIIRYSRLKEDSALGIALSVFFGTGIVLLTFTQRLSDARQAGLDRFLFGQAAALLEGEVILMVVVGVLTLATVLLFWKEFKLISFDPDFAASLGLPVRALEIVLTTQLVIAVVIGLQAVGVILMSAMVLAPAAAARQWTNRLGLMAVTAAFFGASSGVMGTLISATRPGLSTGPVIVLVVSLVALVSFLLAPNRGLVWNWVRHQRNRRQLRTDQVLADLYQLGQQHGNPHHAHSIQVLRTMNAHQGGVEHTLKVLEREGLTQHRGDGHWALTAVGLQAAQQLLAAAEASHSPSEYATHNSQYAIQKTNHDSTTN
jgi:manganese/zinc/iron transport system permease protein